MTATYVTATTMRVSPTLPLADVGVPRDATARFGRMRLRTLGDLLRLDPHRVGDGLLRRMAAWARAGVAYLTQSSLDEAAGHEAMAGVLRARWDGLLAVPPPAAAWLRRTVQGETLGHVVELFRDERRPRTLRFPRGRASEVRAALGLVYARRVLSWILGRALLGAPFPFTLRALADYVLARCDSAQRALLREYYFEGRTTRRSRWATRGSAPCRGSRVLNMCLRKRFGGLCEVAAEPLLHALERAGGMLHRHEVSMASGGADLGQALLVLKTARPHTSFDVWGDAFLTDLPDLDRAARVRALRHALAGSRRYRVPADEARRLLTEATGVTLAKHAVAPFLVGAFGPRILDDDGACVVAQWLAPNQRFAAILEHRGRPMTMDELFGEAAALKDRFPAEPTGFTTRSYPALSFHPDIFSVGGGRWVHRSTLPFPEPVLEAVGAWCAAAVARSDAPVAGRFLLAGLRAAGRAPEGLTEGLLWSVLRRRSDVRVTEQHYYVACRGGSRPATFVERVGRFLLEARRPVTYSELRREFPRELAFSYENVRDRMSELGALLLRMPGGLPPRVGHRACLGTDAGRARLVDEVLRVLPPDGRPEPCTRVPTLLGPARARPLAGLGCPGHFLWALVESDERFDADSGGLVARRCERSGELLDPVVLEVLCAERVATTAAIVRSLLVDYDYGPFPSETVRKKVGASLGRLIEAGIAVRTRPGKGRVEYLIDPDVAPRPQRRP